MKTQDELNAIGDDIRNKLSPLSNLISLLERQKEVDDDMKKMIQVYIDESIEQSKISIDYLTNIL
jgi:hypothetical protein